MEGLVIKWWLTSNLVLGMHMKWKWMELDERGEMHVECGLSFYAFGCMMVIEMIYKIGLLD